MPDPFTKVANPKARGHTFQARVASLAAAKCGLKRVAERGLHLRVAFGGGMDSICGKAFGVEASLIGENSVIVRYDEAPFCGEILNPAT